MKLKRKLLLNTKINANNRKYPLVVLESIRDQINNGEEEKRNFGFVGFDSFMSGNEDLNKEIAFVYNNAVIENESLYVDINILDTPRGEELKILNESYDIRFRPAGRAELPSSFDTNVNVIGYPSVVGDDYKLVTIAAITKEEDAYEE